MYEASMCTFLLYQYVNSDKSNQGPFSICENGSQMLYVSQK